MRQLELPVLGIMPHNFLLAEESLKFWRSWLDSGKILPAIDTVTCNGIMMTYNGDHRLYVANEKHLESLDARVYSLENQSDKIRLNKKEWNKWYNYIVRKQSIPEQMFYEQFGTIAQIASGDERFILYDPKHFMHIFDFIRSQGVRTINDVRTMPTRDEIEAAYEARNHEFRNLQGL